MSSSLPVEQLVHRLVNTTDSLGLDILRKAADGFHELTNGILRYIWVHRSGHPPFIDQRMLVVARMLRKDWHLFIIRCWVPL